MYPGPERLTVPEFAAFSVIGEESSNCAIGTWVPVSAPVTVAPGVKLETVVEV